MAPKPVVSKRKGSSSRGPREHEDESIERPRKNPTPKWVDDYSGIEFVSEVARNNYVARIHSRYIVTEREYSFKEGDFIPYDVLFREKPTHWGWLIPAGGKGYDSATRQFYANLVPEEGEDPMGFTTMVNKKRFKVTIELIREMSGLPTRGEFGIRLPFGKDEDFFDEPTRRAFYYLAHDQ